MVQDTGWYMHALNLSNGKTVGSSMPNVTISTDATGTGDTLHAGEDFQVGTTTFTYQGTATANGAKGFYANITAALFLT